MRVPPATTISFILFTVIHKSDIIYFVVSVIRRSVDEFTLAAKKLWVGLALSTVFMVTSDEEYAAANLRIDGPQ